MEFAAKGLHGTSTEDIARRAAMGVLGAGIDCAHRLMAGTKEQL